MIKTLIFDLGNVLVFFDHQIACRKLGELFAKDPGEVHEFLFASGLEWQYEKGLVSTEELHNQLGFWAGKNSIALADMEHALSDIFRVNDDMVAVLREVKANGYRVVLLSNTSPAHINFCTQNYEFMGLFAAKTLSYKVKAMKPEAPIFKAVLETTEARPEECFYVDDIPEYIAAAATFGIQGSVYTSTPAFREALFAVGVNLGAP